MRNARIPLVSTTPRLGVGRAVFAAVLVGACSQPPSSNDAARAATATQPQPLAAPPGTVAKGHKSGDDEPFMVQTEPFTDSQKAFATAKDALLTKYYAAGLTEDDVYRAAVRGMVEDVDATGHIEIQNTIPGGPAEKAGLQAHDVILSVNGKLYKGKTLIDAV